MSCTGINNVCQKDSFIILALELSILKSLKLQKTIYSKCMLSETKLFPDLVIAVWESLYIIPQL